MCNHHQLQRRSTLRNCLNLLHGIGLLRILSWIVVCIPKFSKFGLGDHLLRIGMALTDSLDELITSGSITPQLAMKVLQQVRVLSLARLVQRTGLPVVTLYSYVDI